MVTRGILNLLKKLLSLYSLFEALIPPPNKSTGLLDFFRETKCNSSTYYFSYLGLNKLTKTSSYLPAKKDINTLEKKNLGESFIPSKIKDEKSLISLYSYGFIIRPHNLRSMSIDNSKVDFPLDEMLSSNDVADSIVSAILAKNNVVYEELIIRRTAGDF